MTDGRQETGGILVINTASGDVHTIIRNSSDDCEVAHGVFYSSSQLFFTDASRGRLCLYKDRTCTPIAGNGHRKHADGQASESSFVQPTGIAMEGTTIFVTDAAVGCIRLVSRLCGTVKYLQMLQDLSVSFGLHLSGQAKPHHTIQQSIEKVDSSVQLLREVETAAQLATGKLAVQGPDGSPASQTVESARMVLTALRNIQRVLDEINGTYVLKLDMAAMLTLVVEHFFSTMRSRYDVPLVLQFCHLFSPVVRESIKQMTETRFQYFLSDKSYYPIPEGGQVIDIAELPQVPMPKKAPLPPLQVTQLQTWRVENGQVVRQLTVRQLSTKDKPGTLPISAYGRPAPEGRVLDVEHFVDTDGEDEVVEDGVVTVVEDEEVDDVVAGEADTPPPSMMALHGRGAQTDKAWQEQQDPCLFGDICCGLNYMSTGVTLMRW